MKKTIGLPISRKENERRRVLTPIGIQKIPDKNLLYLEKGYGRAFGVSDDDFIELGCNVVDRTNVLNKNIICELKIGDSDFLDKIEDKTIFGWIHIKKNKSTKENIVNNKLTAYAWENMFKNDRHIFWRNNEIAGEAAVMHAFQIYGEIPQGKKVAILGRGNVAHGALKVLNLFGAEVTLYSTKTQKAFRKEFMDYDVIVNAVLWDKNRTDHMIYTSELGKMKKGALIIDVSCDRAGAIESSIPTTINNPVYVKDGIMHYVVDHTPSILYRTATKEIEKIAVPYLIKLMNNDIDETLTGCKIAENGMLI